MKVVFKSIAVYILLAMFVAIAIPFNTYAYNVPDFDTVNRQLAEDVEKYRIPGMAVIVVDADKVLFAETYGSCSGIDVPFIIGSMSKSFTALSVMQLAEQEKIDPDAPISDYIDCSAYLKNPADGSRITVKQLLNQTSGLDTYQRFGNAEITSNYGKYQYANVNYGILGEIVSRVSGESYSDYVEQHIFSPLNMNHTSAALENSKADGLTDGYRNYFGIPVPGEPDYPDSNSWSTVPAGYISSSISDMGKYLQMYLNGGEDIISENSIDSMFYDNVPQDESGVYHYGMGWMLSNEFYEPILTHSGLVENFTSNMFIFPESGIGVAVLVNMNDYLVDNNLLGNIILPVLGMEKKEIKGEPYITYHLAIDLIYFMIVVTAAYPLVALKKWKKKSKTKRLLAFDIFRHGVFPAVIISIPQLLGVPLWVIWYFVKDLFIILTVSAALSLCAGIYKIYYCANNFRKEIGE